MELTDYGIYLANWYAQNKRELPWRQTRDPYKIWLSEVMLQQTRVSQGLPYYIGFLEKFPTVYALAEAEEKEVLLEWQGLGYYTRARNLHKCAKTIVSHYGGRFPAQYEQLQELPGVGSYTAAAIASISFGQKVPVLDGNVYRVISRLFDIGEAIDTAKSRKIFMDIAAGMIPDIDPGSFNQAIMEFGALVCVPKNPLCAECVLNSKCLSFSKKNQADRPVKRMKVKKTIRHFNYLVMKNQTGIYMKKRIKNDIWKGLFDFYLLESPNEISKLHDIPGIQKLNGVNDPSTWKLVHVKEYKHLLTHQVIQAKFFLVRCKDPKQKVWGDIQDDGDFYPLEQIDNLPKPVLINKYLKEEIF